MAGSSDGIFYYLPSVPVPPPPLTPDRLRQLKEALMSHGITDDGAEHFVNGRLVAQAQDRRKLVEILNLMVLAGAQFPKRPHTMNDQDWWGSSGYRGKG